MSSETLKNKMKKIATKSLLVLVLLGCLTAMFAILIFYRLYIVSKKSVISTWSYNSEQLSHNVDHYLNTPKDAVIFTSQGVEEMMATGQSNEEILKYLVAETKVYSSLIESNNTGIYGYCNGEYLDGSGWDVPKDYDATTRPWYISAVEADGDIAFVKPYMNMQTNKYMMSVSKLLSDKKSVISMDIFLDSIQDIEEEISKTKQIDFSMIVDESGMIVAHSDSAEVGKNYLEEEMEYTDLVKEAFLQEEGMFITDIDGKSKLVFCDRVNNEWCSMIILDQRATFRNAKYIYMSSAIALIVIFLAYFTIINIYDSKQKEAGQLQREISAIGDIYTSLSLVDLDNHTIRKLRVSEALDKALGGKYELLLDRNSEYIKKLVAEPFQNTLIDFADLSTLEERLKDIKAITFEFADIHGKWNRMQFVVAQRDEEGKLHQVLWAIESIDEAKKRQEHFKKLAETDALTGVLNRNGGETKIYEAIEKDKVGMVLLLDADHFKFVNDTYGHDMGDQVIIALARCLTETFRDSDVVFRLGGDEFAVFAEGVDDKEIGRLVVDRLFKNIDNIDFPEMPDWRLQVSIGAVFSNDSENACFSDLYQKADKAMYESKQHKGSYVTFHEG